MKSVVLFEGEAPVEAMKEYAAGRRDGQRKALPLDDAEDELNALGRRFSSQRL